MQLHLFLHKLAFTSLRHVRRLATLDPATTRAFIDKLRAQAGQSPSGAEPAISFEVGRRAVLRARLNAAVSLLAFPVHAWGFWLGLSPLLLAWPLIFSSLWLYYSVLTARRNVAALHFTTGWHSFDVDTLSFWGTPTRATPTSLPLSTARAAALPDAARQGVLGLDVQLSKGRRQRFLLRCKDAQTLNERALGRLFPPGVLGEAMGKKTEGSVF